MADTATVQDEKDPLWLRALPYVGRVLRNLIELAIIVAVLVSEQGDPIVRAALVLIYLTVKVGIGTITFVTSSAMLQTHRHHLHQMAMMRQRISPPRSEAHERIDEEVEADEDAEFKKTYELCAKATERPPFAIDMVFHAIGLYLALFVLLRALL